MGTFCEEIDKFKIWADSIPNSHKSGEWECDYTNWGAIYSKFSSYIKTLDLSLLSATDIQVLIYAIARDNEDEELIAILSQETALFKRIFSEILICEENDAKWQLANLLGTDILERELALSTLLQLFKDNDEYVRRMALQSLGKLNYSNIERLCEEAWVSNDEYQRIVVLWVLNEVGSAKLTKYLLLAKNDTRKHLRYRAEKLLQTNEAV